MAWLGCVAQVDLERLDAAARAELMGQGAIACLDAGDGTTSCWQPGSLSTAWSAAEFEQLVAGSLGRLSASGACGA